MVDISCIKDGEDLKHKGRRLVSMMSTALSKSQKWLFVLCFGLLPVLCAQAAVPEGTAWDAASAGRLQVIFPGTDYSASWQFNRCVCGDVLVNSESSLPGEQRQGDMLLVGGRAVVYRGFDTERPEEVMSIDAPALMMQLVFRLLEHARPKGPPGIEARETVLVAGETEPVTLDSGQAVGSFFAPWTVKGTLSPGGDAAINFDIHFGFNVTPPGEGEEQLSSMDLSGTIDYKLQDFPVTDESPLGELRLVWRDSDDPAIAGAQDIVTLGDLRQLISDNPW
jgi:hypothetical protein